MDIFPGELSKKLFDSVFTKKILIDSIQKYLTLKEKKIFSMANSKINEVFNESIKVVELNKFINLMTLILSHKNISAFYNNINKLNLTKLQNLFLKFNDEIENYDILLNFISLKSLWIEETKITKIDFITKMKNLDNVFI